MEEDISRFVCHTLDHTGYGWNEIMLRRNYWREYACMLNKIHLTNNTGTNMIIAGSNAEGITSNLEIDLDILMITSGVFCSDRRVEFCLQPDLTIFQTEMASTSPGYTKLKLTSFNGNTFHSIIEKSLFRVGSGVMFASSALFASSVLNLEKNSGGLCTYHDISGPALPVAVFNDSMVNIVLAFPCIHSDILQSFRTRQRQHDWPPIHIIQDDSPAVCQLVPVGYKGSCNQMMEWRFCFIPTEMSLTHSLNETQLKLYIVLKKIAKEIFKCNDISSYILKNIIFWTSEQLGTHTFRKENLMALVLRTLGLLKVSIENFCLPYFMIPGRNLLAERLELNTRRNLTNLISQLLDEGPRLLLRCSKLQVEMTVMYRSPEELVDYRNTNESAERWHYLMLCFFQYILCRRIADIDSLKGIINILYPDIIFPDWRELTALGVDSLPIILQRVMRFLFPDWKEPAALGVDSLPINLQRDIRLLFPDRRELEELGVESIPITIQRVIGFLFPDLRELAALGNDSLPIILQRFIHFLFPDWRELEALGDECLPTMLHRFMSLLWSMPIT